MKQRYYFTSESGRILISDFIGTVDEAIKLGENILYNENIYVKCGDEIVEVIFN